VEEEHQLRSEGEDRGECLASRPGSFILGPTERVGVGSRAGLETLLKKEISRYCQESNVCDTCVTCPLLQLRLCLMMAQIGSKHVEYYNDV